MSPNPNACKPHIHSTELLVLLLSLIHSLSLKTHRRPRHALSLKTPSAPAKGLGEECQKCLRRFCKDTAKLKGGLVVNDDGGCIVTSTSYDAPVNCIKVEVLLL